jgi:hypothetical protein
MRDKSVQGKLPNGVTRAMSLNENTGRTRFSFKMHGEKFFYTGKLDRKGYFLPECNENELRLLNIYTKTRST